MSSLKTFQKLAITADNIEIDSFIMNSIINQMAWLTTAIYKNNRESTCLIAVTLKSPLQMISKHILNEWSAHLCKPSSQLKS